MSQQLCFTVQFLSPLFHGRGDGAAHEWPPSPLRLFQGLVRGAADRWPGAEFEKRAVPALAWLERQPPPAILAPGAEETTGYRLSAPNNALDVAAAAWVRGNYTGKDAQPATHRSLKTVRPVRLREEAPVHFLWPLPDAAGAGAAGYVEDLRTAARSVVALGWGVDLVVADARVLPAAEAAAWGGLRWRPGEGRLRLRAPRPGSLEALRVRHARFLNRLGSGRIDPTPPFTAFVEVPYAGEGEAPARPWTAFEFQSPGAERRRAFSTRRTAAIAGMLRHAAADAAREVGRSPDWIAAYVLGHGAGPRTQALDAPRFAYLPLPSLDPRGVVGELRRALLAEPLAGPGDARDWAARTLPFQELVAEGESEPSAILAPLARGDWVLRRYTAPTPAAAWATVTPVLLPRYDDRKPAKTERILRETIVEAGYSPELARDAELEWDRVGFWRGLELASRYFTPKHLAHCPRYHVRVRWRDPRGRPLPLTGPLCLGAGRFCGLGLFAAE